MNTSTKRTTPNGLVIDIKGDVDIDGPFDVDAIRAEVMCTDTNKEPHTVVNESIVVLDFSYVQDKYEKELGKAINSDTANPEELNRFILDAAENVYENIPRFSTSSKGRIVSKNGRLKYIPEVDMRSTAHQGVPN